MTLSWCGSVGTPSSAGAQAGGPGGCSQGHQCRPSEIGSCEPRPAVGAGSSLSLARPPGAPTKPTAAQARPAREPPPSTRVSSRGRVDRGRDRPTAQPRLRGVRVLLGLVEEGLCWGRVEAAGGPLCPSHAPQHRCFASTTAGASSPPPELRWRCTPAREAVHAANHSRLPGPVLHEPAGTRLWLETMCRQHRASLPGSWLCLPHAPPSL